MCVFNSLAKIYNPQAIGNLIKLYLTSLTISWDFYDEVNVCRNFFENNVIR